MVEDKRLKNCECLSCKHEKVECVDTLMDANIANKLSIHKNLCDSIHNLYKTKNFDYGDSMRPLFDEYGLTSFLVLFEIKLNRIKNLNKSYKPNHESLEDSLMDLANYALMALTEIKNRKEEK